MQYIWYQLPHQAPESPRFLAAGRETINPKAVGGERGGVSLTPAPVVFLKNVSSKERVKSWFFVTFNIIQSHIFPENFVEIPQVVQKLWRISVSISYFHQFSTIFRIFGHFLVTKKLMTSAYNKWCQHFFTFNIL